MTKYQLFALLAANHNERISIGDTTGVFIGISREDGSGHCFNITLDTDAYGLNANGPIYKTVFVRTID